MASDYGDDAGEKMIEDFMRFGERMGERAMYDRAKRMEAAFEKARDAARSTPAEGGAREEPAEWAKLDMAKFREIEGYEGVKDIISTKLRSHSVDSAWFEDPGSGKEYLLFRISDVEEVCRSFDGLSKEAGKACDRAAAGLAKLRADNVNILLTVFPSASLQSAHCGFTACPSVSSPPSLIFPSSPAVCPSAGTTCP